MVEGGGAAAPGFPLLDRVADRLAALDGWRRRLFLVTLGASLTLALPPVQALPVLYLVFPAVVWMLAGAGGRLAAFAIGWWFGLGYFAVGLYWLANALLTFAERHAWLLPFANLGLPAFLALFTGLATVLAACGRGGLQRALLLAVGWGATDWLRGHILTGLPWNLAGHAWIGSDALLQLAAATGIYGVGLVAVLSAALPAAAAGVSRRRGLAVLLAALAIPAAAWTGGFLRLAEAPPPTEDRVAGVGLRLVQAAIPQREKWRRDLRGRNLGLHMRLSREGRPGWITHVIWPETAATFFLEEDAAARRAIAAVAPPGGVLVTGAPRRARDPLRLWNSVIALDGKGDVVATYDKFHLVPFGEYVPLARYLPLDRIAGGGIGYTPGPGPRTLRLPGLPPVSPLICFEAIFPGAVLDSRDRPAWLLNLTNDAWYGLSAGPYQHLAIARVRAVEEGVPLVRAAYSGISAVFDAYGRERARLGLGERGVLDVRLPRPAPEVPLYGRYGDSVFALMLGFVLAIALLLRSARKETKPRAL